MHCIMNQWWHTQCKQYFQTQATVTYILVTVTYVEEKCNKINSSLIMGAMGPLYYGSVMAYIVSKCYFKKQVTVTYIQVKVTYLRQNAMDSQVANNGTLYYGSIVAYLLSKSFMCLMAMVQIQ